MYSYIVVHDYGFAPNPFHGWCTLAACTPNHMGIKAKPGDWIIGFEEARRRHNLLYAMQVDHVLHFDDYHSDKRFRSKMPRYSGDWRELCGDNLYFTAPSGEWDRVDSPLHLEPELFAKDTKHPYAFVGKHFYYFGEEAVKTPRRFQSLVHARHGCKASHDPATVEMFVSWLQSTFDLGMAAEPRDGAEMRALLESYSNTSCSQSRKKRNHSNVCAH